MSFENFYKEADKSDRRWRMILMAALLLVLGYFAIPFVVSNFRNPSTEGQRQSSLVERRIRRVDELCRNLPIPERFYFKRRVVTNLEEYLTAVTYFYKTERDSDEIMPIFRDWFASNGWQTTPQSFFIYKKGNQTISIKRPFESEFREIRHYEIVCEEISYEIRD